MFLKILNILITHEKFWIQMTQLVVNFQKEDLNSNWSDRSLQLHKKKINKEMTVLELCVEPLHSTPLPILSVTLFVYMATWYTNTPSVMEKGKGE